MVAALAVALAFGWPGADDAFARERTTAPDLQAGAIVIDAESGAVIAAQNAEGDARSPAPRSS